MTGRRRSILALGLLATCISPAFSANASETVNYTYDARGRLVKVARSGTVNNGVSACYAYDKADNRSNVTVETATDCAGGSGVSFSISSDGAVTEGANSVFTVTKTGTATTSLSVSYTTANGTAAAPGDFTSASASLTFTTAETSKTVSVPTIDDTSSESAETFTMTLSAPSGGAALGTASATATVNDNDAAATCSGVSFTIGTPTAVTEGTSPVFTVTKTGTATGSCSVSFATANGTATAGSDYTAASGTLSFLTADTSKTFSVATIDDTTVESAETFAASLSNPTGGATLGSPSSATATVNDNDSGGTCNGVSFSVNDRSGDEGTTFSFTVTKSGSTTSSCSINYATANNTAVAPGDFTAIASTLLTFAPSETTKTVGVIVKLNGASAEPTETFFLNLSGATGGATISDSQGVGTIYDVFDENPCPLC